MFESDNTPVPNYCYKEIKTVYLPAKTVVKKKETPTYILISIISLVKVVYVLDNLGVQLI